jgi:hypothetical protein
MRHRWPWTVTASTPQRCTDCGMEAEYLSRQVVVAQPDIAGSHTFTVAYYRTRPTRRHRWRNTWTMPPCPGLPPRRRRRPRARLR